MRNTLRFLGYCALFAMSLICIFRLSYGFKQANNIKQTNLAPIQTINNPEPILENTPQIIETVANIANTEIEEKTKSYCPEETIVTLIQETSLEELKSLGWRFPKKTDYPSEIYSEIKKHYKKEIKADFDGDGKIDKAILLVRNSENQFDANETGIFIFLSQNSNQSTVYHIPDTNLLYLGLNLQKPQQIETMDCSMTLKNPGIEISYYESCGGEIIFWDNTKNKFFSLYTGC
ncbi:MAG: hypothetical protein J0M03_19290 [Acidobacteria bacterium]|nr:hypothetical protein [Acidobacteriota bacterium]